MSGRIFKEPHLIVWWGVDPECITWRPLRWHFDCIIQPRRDLTEPGAMIAGLHFEFWIDWRTFGIALFRVAPSIK